MKNWFMLTLVGKDQAGIVAKVSAALYQENCNLGEASMTRLGGNFTIMLMVQFDGQAKTLDRILEPVCSALKLHYHVDPIDGELHHHLEPDVQISVHGADKAGIVSEVTRVLTEAGLDILNLESDVGGTNENPLYIMNIEGVAVNGISALNDALKNLNCGEDVEVHLSEIDILRG
jgi:glycine cleavage system transcriptional repressor